MLEVVLDAKKESVESTICRRYCQESGCDDFQTSFSKSMIGAKVRIIR